MPPVILELRLAFVQCWAHGLLNYHMLGTWAIEMPYHGHMGYYILGMGLPYDDQICLQSFVCLAHWFMGCYMLSILVMGMTYAGRIGQRVAI